MDDAEILRICNEIANPHGLTVEFVAAEGIMAIGVGGDCRTVARPVVLVGPFSRHEVLAAVSTKICNDTPTNRVTYDITSVTTVTSEDIS